MVRDRAVLGGTRFAAELRGSQAEVSPEPSRKITRVGKSTPFRHHDHRQSSQMRVAQQLCAALESHPQELLHERGLMSRERVVQRAGRHVQPVRHHGWRQIRQVQTGVQCRHEGVERRRRRALRVRSGGESQERPDVLGNGAAGQSQLSYGAWRESAHHDTQRAAPSFVRKVGRAMLRAGHPTSQPVSGERQGDCAGGLCALDTMGVTRIDQDAIVGRRDDFPLCGSKPGLAGARLEEDPIAMATAGNE